MSADPTSLRTLQPSAWRRAVGLGIVAVLVLSVVLQEPVSALLPEGTPRWLLFLAIALPIAGALVLGLSWAYPRVLLAADGTLRVRGRVVPLGEVVGLRRSVSSGPSAGYLVYTFATSDGRTIRVLVAGAPIRGLDLEQLGVLREAVAASGIRSAVNAAEVERAIIGQNLLADGRRAEVDRERALRELDGLRGVAHRENPVPASRAESEAAAVVAVDSDAARADDWALQAADDDREAARMVDAASGGTRMLRRLALVAFVLTCLVGVGVLITLVVREASGAWVGDVSSDALVTSFVIVLALALVTGIVWGVAADVDDAQRRRLAQRWLTDASPEQRERGLPSPFHAAWMRVPGGRMTGFALFVVGMVAMLTVVGGPVALFGGFGPPAIGAVVTVVGLVLSALALWGWFARRRAHARRVEWLLEVAGERVHGGEAPTR